MPPATPRVASIEYQHVLSAKPVQALEQHLPLADLWAVQNQRIEQLDTRTKQTEQCRFAHTALALGVEQRQANLRRIRCQHPQPLPARLIGKRFINQPQQLRVEWIEDIRKEAATCLRERAGGDPSRQAGSPRQQREECIEFALNGTAHTAKQESDQIGEGQATRTREIPGVAASRFEKGGALDEVRKPRKYVDIFRPSYLTYKYQSVTAHILTHPRLSKDLTQEYAEMLSHEDCDLTDLWVRRIVRVYRFKDLA